VVIHLGHFHDNYLLGLCAFIAGDFVFLPDELKLSKMAASDWKDAKSTPLLLYLRFKYLLPTLRGLKRLDTQHLLYLQLRRSVLEQIIFCERRQIIVLGGLALQVIIMFDYLRLVLNWILNETGPLFLRDRVDLIMSQPHQKYANPIATL